MMNLKNQKLTIFNQTVRAVVPPNHRRKSRRGQPTNPFFSSLRGIPVILALPQPRNLRTGLHTASCNVEAL